MPGGRALLLFLPFLVACPGPLSRRESGPVTLQVPGEYVHAGSGLRFPVATGSFSRENIKGYDEARTNIGVGYNCLHPDHLMAATVFVYPSTAPAQEYRECKEALMGAYPDAVAVEESAAEFTRGGQSIPGRRGTFDYEMVFAGRLQPVRSQLIVITAWAGRWTIKYRMTYPRAADPTSDGTSILELPLESR